jgi:hypothetical protein
MAAKKSKKATVESNGKEPPRARGSNGAGISRVHVGREDELPELEFVFDETPRPALINPESSEEREKRLAARKALTLRAFRMTYENRRRKAS